MSPLADLDRWIAPLGGALLHFVWQGALVALVAWAAMTLARPPRVRYAVGCVAMALMLACPIATVAWIGPDAPRVVPSAPAPTPAITPLASPPRLAGEPARREVRPTTPPTPLPAPTFRQRLAPLAGPLVAAWLVGVALVATWHLVGLARVARLRATAAPIRDDLWQARLRALAGRLGLRRAIALCATTRLDCPAVVGAFRPMILWPAAALTGLTPQQVDALLAHELAHVARHDYLVNLLQAVVETLLFYHPAVWWLSRRIRATREHCCDDLAAEAVGDPVTYAGALAAMESLRAAPPLAVGARGGSLLDRVQRLLAAPTVVRRSPAVGRRATLALLAVTLALATWSARAGDDATTRPVAAVPSSHRIGVGDRVRFTYVDDATPRTSETTVINDRGELALPTLGRMTIAGMTVAEATDALAGRIARGNNDMPGARTTLDVVTVAPAQPILPGDRLSVFFEARPGDKPIAQLLDVDPRGRIELLPPHTGGPLPATFAIDVANLTPDAAAKSINVRAGTTSTTVVRIARRPDAATRPATTQAAALDRYRALARHDLSIAQLLVRRDRLDTPLRADAQPTDDSAIESVANNREILDLRLAERAEAITRDPALAQATDEHRRFRALQDDRATKVEAIGRETDGAADGDRWLHAIDAELAALARGVGGEYFAHGPHGPIGVRRLDRPTTIREGLAAIGIPESEMPRDQAGEAWIDVIGGGDDIAGERTPAQMTLRLALSDVLAGRHDDVPLLPNDQIAVGVRVPPAAVRDAIRNAVPMTPAGIRLDAHPLARRDLAIARLAARRDHLDLPVRADAQPDSFADAVDAVRATIDAQIAKRATEIAASPNAVATDPLERQYAKLQSKRSALEAAPADALARARLADVQMQTARLVLSGSYNVTGRVERPGVYSVTGGNITLRQAITSAGPKDDVGDLWIGLTVHAEDAPKPPAAQFRFSAGDLLSGQQADVLLLPGDLVTVGVAPPTTTAPAATRPAARLAPGERVRVVIDDVAGIRREQIVRVPADGEARGLHEGIDRIMLAGQTPDALAAEIRRQLAADGRPDVPVSITRVDESADVEPPTTRPDRPIEPGDELQLRWIEGGRSNHAHTLSVRVGGTITMPPLEGPISVAGLTPSEAARLLNERLRRGGFAGDWSLDVAIVGHRDPNRVAAETRARRLRDVARQDFVLARDLADRARLDTPLRPELNGDDARAALDNVRLTLDARLEERAAAFEGGNAVRENTQEAQSYLALQSQRRREASAGADAARLAQIDATAETFARGGGFATLEGIPALGDATNVTGRLVTLRDVCRHVSDPGADVARVVDVRTTVRGLPDRTLRLRFDLRDVMAGRHDDFYLLGEDAVRVAPLPANAPGVRRLSHGDVLAIRVVDLAGVAAGGGWTLRRVVPQSGEVDFGGLGSFAATGRTTDELATAIAGRIKDRRPQQRPLVEIRLDDGAAATTAPAAEATRIAPGDVVQLTFVARVAADDSRGPADVRVKDVAADGTISVEGIGRITVAGRTPGEAAAAIADGLRAAGRTDVASVGVTTLRRAGVAGGVPMDTAWERVAASAPTTVPADYLLAAGDLLRIELSDPQAGADLKLIKRVSGGGLISLPYLDEPVKVGGLSEIAAERMIVKTYRDRQILEQAAVSVLAVQRSDGVNVPGELLGARPAAAEAPAARGEEAAARGAAAADGPGTRPVAVGDVLTIFLGDARGGEDEMKQSIVAQNGFIQLGRTEKSRFPEIRDLPAAGRSDLDVARAIAEQIRAASPEVRPLVRLHNHHHYGEPATAGDAVAPPQEQQPTSRPVDDRIAAGDLVRVTVYELMPENKPGVFVKRVAADGTVTLIHLGKPLTLAGLTPAEAERAVVRAYETAQVLSGGQADVLVVQPANGPAVPAAALGVPAQDDAAMRARIDALTAEIEALKRAATRPAQADAPPATTRAAAGAIDERTLTARDPFFARLVGTRDEIVLELARLQQMHGRGSPVVVKMESNLDALNRRITQIREAMQRELPAGADPDLARLVAARSALAAELDAMRGSLGPDASAVLRKQGELATLDRQIAARRR